MDRETVNTVVSVLGLLAPGIVWVLYKFHESGLREQRQGLQIANLAEDMARLKKEFELKLEIAKKDAFYDNKDLNKKYSHRYSLLHREIEDIKLNLAREGKAKLSSRKPEEDDTFDDADTFN